MTVLVKPTPSKNFVRGFIAGVHRGMDWGWQASSAASFDILAATDGVVESVYTGTGYNGGWGRRIVINYGTYKGFTIKTAYNHMRAGGVLVKAGQRVKAGQKIGLQGSSGAATGTHLHFELYINGVRVNPQPYFSSHLPGTPVPVAPKPAATKRKVDLGRNGWYWYRSAADAAAGRNKQGTGRGQIMLSGPYPVLAIASNGAIQVLSNSMGKVWLHPSARSQLR